MTTIKAEFDGVLFSSWTLEGGAVVRRVSQPSERRILDANAELRKEPGAIKTLDWGELALQVPERAFWWLVKNHDPDLNAPHSMTRRAAWLRLLNHRDFEDFRVKPRNLARG